MASSGLFVVHDGRIVAVGTLAILLTRDCVAGPRGRSIPAVLCLFQGKSTLTNWLLQRKRSLTGPEPGLTRDAVAEHFIHEGRTVELVDTAGWMRRARLANYDDSGFVNQCCNASCFRCPRHVQQPASEAAME